MLAPLPFQPIPFLASQLLPLLTFIATLEACEAHLEGSMGRMGYIYLPFWLDFNFCVGFFSAMVNIPVPWMTWDQNKIKLAMGDP